MTYPCQRSSERHGGPVAAGLRGGWGPPSRLKARRYLESLRASASGRGLPATQTQQPHSSPPPDASARRFAGHSALPGRRGPRQVSGGGPAAGDHLVPHRRRDPNAPRPRGRGCRRNTPRLPEQRSLPAGNPLWGTCWPAHRTRRRDRDGQPGRPGGDRPAGSTRPPHRPSVARKPPLNPVRPPIRSKSSTAHMPGRGGPCLPPGPHLCLTAAGRVCPRARTFA